MTDQELASSWTLALPEHEDGDARITPLDTGEKLLKAAQDMGNCLATMAKGSIEGAKAIYLIRRNGHIAAAVELLNTNGHWRTGQIEATAHGRPSIEDLQTAAELASRYSEASTRTRT